jgi:hypothetical protein
MVPPAGRTENEMIIQLALLLLIVVVLDLKVKIIVEKR